jgi:hypothetical protein
MAEQVSQDIWTIIGLSSLIASVVTIVLGLIRDVLVERYRFRRQSQSGFIQKQLQILSRIYFTLERMRKQAAGDLLFKESWDTFRDINKIIEEDMFLLSSRICNQLLKVMAYIPEVLKEKGTEHWREQATFLVEEIDKILNFIEEEANKKLIPKYRSIVGETVSNFSRNGLEDKT